MRGDFATRLAECAAIEQRERAAMTERQLTSTDPEPAIGTVVLDATGRWWRRSAHIEDRKCWVQLDEDGATANRDSESWTVVAGSNGPVTVQERGQGDRRED